MFFLDVLRQYVFDADNCPDEEVTKLMMSFVVTTKLPKDKASQRKVRTKNISPFEGLEYSDNMTHFPCILLICLQKNLILLVRYKIETVEGVLCIQKRRTNFTFSFL